MLRNIFVMVTCMWFRCSVVVSALTLFSNTACSERTMFKTTRKQPDHSKAFRAGTGWSSMRLAPELESLFREPRQRAPKTRILVEGTIRNIERRAEFDTFWFDLFFDSPRVSLSPPETKAAPIALKPGTHALVSIALPERVPLPFSVGDAITFACRVDYIGIHQVVHGTITRGQTGEVLLAHSADGDVAFAPGWSLDWGPVVSEEKGTNGKNAAKRQYHRPTLTYRNRHARIVEGNWRQLEVDHESWLVTATAIGWSSTGVRPPDASSYATYFIVRRHPSLKKPLPQK